MTIEPRQAILPNQHRPWDNFTHQYTLITCKDGLLKEAAILRIYKQPEEERYTACFWINSMNANGSAEGNNPSKVSRLAMENAGVNIEGDYTYPPLLLHALTPAFEYDTYLITEAHA